jgi:hypothetical protein
MLEEAITSIEKIMDKHNQKHLANGIADFIFEFLVACAGP